MRHSIWLKTSWTNIWTGQDTGPQLKTCNSLLASSNNKWRQLLNKQTKDNKCPVHNKLSHLKAQWCVWFVVNISPIQMLSTSTKSPQDTCRDASAKFVALNSAQTPSSRNTTKRLPMVCRPKGNNRCLPWKLNSLSNNHSPDSKPTSNSPSNKLKPSLDNSPKPSQKISK